MYKLYTLSILEETDCYGIGFSLIEKSDEQFWSALNEIIPQNYALFNLCMMRFGLEESYITPKLTWNIYIAKISVQSLPANMNMLHGLWYYVNQTGINNNINESIPRQQSLWGQHGAHLRPVSPRWAPCWPHEQRQTSYYAKQKKQILNPKVWSRLYPLLNQYLSYIMGIRWRSKIGNVDFECVVLNVLNVLICQVLIYMDYRHCAT